MDSELLDGRYASLQGIAGNDTFGGAPLSIDSIDLSRFGTRAWKGKERTQNGKYK
jgi:hypothetical protein